MRVMTPFRAGLCLVLSHLAVGCTYGDWVNPWGDAASDVVTDLAGDAPIDAPTDASADVTLDASADADAASVGGSEHVRVGGCGGSVGNGIMLRNTWVLTAASALGGADCAASGISVTATAAAPGAALQRATAAAVWRDESHGVALIQLASPLQLAGGFGDFGFARELSADSAARLAGVRLSCFTYDPGAPVWNSAVAREGDDAAHVHVALDLDAGVASHHLGGACVNSLGAVAAIALEAQGRSSFNAVAVAAFRPWAEDLMFMRVGGGVEPAPDSLPTAIATADRRRLDLFIRSESNTLFHRTRLDGAWEGTGWGEPISATDSLSGPMATPTLLRPRSNVAGVGWVYNRAYFIDLAYIDGTGALWLTSLRGSDGWKGPIAVEFYAFAERRHGALASLASSGLDRVDMVGVRPSHVLAHDFMAIGRWAGWQSGSNWERLADLTIADDARPVLLAVSGRLELFARDRDHHLRHNTYGAPDGWRVWTSLSGTLRSDPVAVSPGRERLDVVAQGDDDTLQAIHLVNGVWSGWETVSGGPRLAGPPAAVSRRADVTHVYVRGSDGALWSVAYDGSTWRSWQRLGGAVISDPVVAPSTRGNEVFVITDDHTLRMHTH